VKPLQDGHCYTVREVFPDAPEGAHFRSVGSHSLRPVFIYRADACAGPPYDPTPLSVGEVVINPVLHSFKIG
jgi:hypothetical protein